MTGPSADLHELRMTPRSVPRYSAPSFVSAFIRLSAKNSGYRSKLICPIPTRRPTTLSETNDTDRRHHKQARETRCAKRVQLRPDKYFRLRARDKTKNNPFSPTSYQSNRDINRRSCRLSRDVKFDRQKLGSYAYYVAATDFISCPIRADQLILGWLGFFRGDVAPPANNYSLNFAAPRRKLTFNK